MSVRLSEPAQRLHWALAVLCLLRERPMHPYEMRLLMRERHKNERLVLKAGSLYHAIGWLERNGQIGRAETNRQGKRPERTVYRITEQGQRDVLKWLKELLSTRLREPSSFLVALDHLVHLSPEDAAAELEKRLRQLEPDLRALEFALETLAPKIGRINLIEIEFERALGRAEMLWLQQVMQDLRSGHLVWDINQILVYLRQGAFETAAGGKSAPSTRSVTGKR